MRKDNVKEQTIFIDPTKFKDRVPTENGTGKTEYIFDDGDVLKFLIDEMNEAGVDIAMIHQVHEHAIEYHGRRDFFGIGIASMDAPEDAVIDGMAELSDMLNDYEGTESWVSYKNGKHSLHITESEAESEEKPEEEVSA